MIKSFTLQPDPLPDVADVDASNLRSVLWDTKK